MEFVVLIGLGAICILCGSQALKHSYRAGYCMGRADEIVSAPPPPWAQI